MTKEDIIQICRDSLKVENLTNSGTDRDTYSFKLYFETVADKISSRLNAPVKPANDIKNITELLRQLIKHSEDCGYYSDGSDSQLTAEKEKKRVFNEIISRLSV